MWNKLGTTVENYMIPQQKPYARFEHINLPRKIFHFYSTMIILDILRKKLINF